MEVLEGCAILICGLVALARMLGPLVRGLRQAGEDRRLLSLMTEFAAGADRSRRRLGEIHHLLTDRLAGDTEYVRLADAVATLAPGGVAFAGAEPRLAALFRAYLREYGLDVPDEPQDRAGIWPPPPMTRSGRDASWKDEP
jgi:hypothetical protein